MTPLTLICSWCTRVLREGALPASHGICPTCAARLTQPPVSAVERMLEEAR
jgi:hypothetical protein